MVDQFSLQFLWLRIYYGCLLFFILKFPVNFKKIFYSQEETPQIGVLKKYWAALLTLLAKSSAIIDYSLCTLKLIF